MGGAGGTDQGVISCSGSRGSHRQGSGEKGLCDGGLSKEDTVRLSKFTLGREIEEEAMAGEETSQEKVIVSISQQVDSFAEMGFLRASSHPIDSAIATAVLEKRL